MEDIMRYSQGLASEEYNNYTNRLAALAGVGQTSAANMGANALTTGQGIANSYTNAGNARASGILGVANTLGNTMNNAAWMYGMYGGGGGGSGGFGFTPGQAGGMDRYVTDYNFGRSSDIRLKRNIEQIAPGLYKWEWNEIAHSIGVAGEPTVGELAQEVMLTEPERVRVGPHGYLQIRVA
jgi:hypothetical protein